MFWYLIHVEQMVKGNSISIDVKEDKCILDGQKFHCEKDSTVTACV